MHRRMVTCVCRNARTTPFRPLDLLGYSCSRIVSNDVDGIGTAHTLRLGEGLFACRGGPIRRSPIQGIVLAVMASGQWGNSWSTTISWARPWPRRWWWRRCRIAGPARRRPSILRGNLPKFWR